MFSKSTKKTTDAAIGPDEHSSAQESAVDAVHTGAYKTTISSGSTFCGELEVDTDLQVDGMIKGRLQIGKRFVIGKGGQVVSEGIDCAVAEISGKLEGPITATEMLTIHAGGHIKGDIAVRDVVIEKGGRLDGRCQYLSSEPPRDSKLSITSSESVTSKSAPKQTGAAPL